MCTYFAKNAFISQDFKFMIQKGEVTRKLYVTREFLVFSEKKKGEIL